MTRNHVRRGLVGVVTTLAFVLTLGVTSASAGLGDPAATDSGNGNPACAQGGDAGSADAGAAAPDAPAASDPCPGATTDTSASTSGQAADPDPDGDPEGDPDPNADTQPPVWVVQAAGGSCGINVGLAFDGTNLIVSCYDDSRLDLVSPEDGSLVRTIDVPGLSSLGAIAYDGGRDLLYACNSSSEVVAIDLVAETSTSLFSSLGCFDGLAFDATNDTFWASPDANPNVSHYEYDGTLIGTTTVSLGGCGNSGIAIGGDLLFLANNGCSQIYTTPKTDLSQTELFAELNTRLEDMECDPISFKNGLPDGGDAAQVMWVIDAYDRTLSAFALPENLCGFGGQPPGEPPVAVCAASATTGEVPLTVDFDGDSSTGQIDSFHWDFGDGATAEGSVVSHTYTTPGSYTAVLTVTNEDGSSSCSVPVTAQAVAPSSTTSTSTTAPPGTLPVTGSSAGSQTRLGAWLFGAGVLLIALSSRTRVAFAFARSGNGRRRHVRRTFGVRVIDGLTAFFGGTGRRR